MLTVKEQYRNLCMCEASIPIFSRDWWLDAVCGEDHWDVDIVERDGQIVTSLPYYKYKKYGFDIITMPQLTQTMGMWIRYPKDQEYFDRIEYEKEIVGEIVNGGGG